MRAERDVIDHDTGGCDGPRLQVACDGMGGRRRGYLADRRDVMGRCCSEDALDHCRRGDALDHCRRGDVMDHCRRDVLYHCRRGDVMDHCRRDVLYHCRRGDVMDHIPAMNDEYECAAV